mmetsp:Transcript_21128/g.53780  ORF Transcript_21128/g.53780 Transcript_21128/m.53780 type:complete len:83 (-) Transcript_21128:8-256(-)
MSSAELADEKLQKKRKIWAAEAAEECKRPNVWGQQETSLYLCPRCLTRQAFYRQRENTARRRLELFLVCIACQHSWTWWHAV